MVDLEAAAIIEGNLSKRQIHPTGFVATATAD